MRATKADVKKLSGEGVDGLEDCPPLYHMEFGREQFIEFMDNPVGVLKELGI